MVYVSVLSAAVMLSCVAVGVGADEKGSATGTRKWTRKTQDGTEQEIKAELKQDADKVTGKVISPIGEFEIKEGKVKEGKISFKLMIERDGNTIKIDFSGKLDGDRIKGTVEF